MREGANVPWLDVGVSANESHQGEFPPDCARVDGDHHDGCDDDRAERACDCADAHVVRLAAKRHLKSS